MKTKANKKTAKKTRKPVKVSRRKTVKRGRKAAQKPKASTADKKRIKRLTAKLKKANRTSKAVVKLMISIQKDLAFVMSK